MQKELHEKITAPIQRFNLPDYDQIPDVGLYLEQTVRYISEYLAPLPNVTVTNSMVGNYVKKGLIDNPVKKVYRREQIAYLIFIAVAKTVLSLEDVQLLIRLQKQSYPGEVAYGYFVREFTNVLRYVFGLKERLDAVGKENSDEKTMLRNTIVAVAHKIHLDMCFSAIHELQDPSEKE